MVWLVRGNSHGFTFVGEDKGEGTKFRWSARWGSGVRLVRTDVQAYTLSPLHITRRQVDPQFYAFRWITLLLSQVSECSPRVPLK